MAGVTTIRPATTLNSFLQYGNVGATGAGGAYTTLHPNVQFGNLSQPNPPKPTSAPRVPPRVPQQQQQAAAPQAPAAAPASAYDYSSDPILQAIRAGGIRSRANAEAAALAGRKQLAIQFGDATGIVDDTNTAKAAKDNPFSSLAEIMRGYGRSVTSTDEALNKDNLFYSGHRGVELSRLLEDRQRQEYGARGAAQQQLTGITSELARALEDATLRDAQAESDAKDRALQQALLYGVDPGVGGPLTPPAPPPAPPPALPRAAATGGFQPQEEATKQSLAGTAGPTMQVDPWLLAAMQRRTSS